MIPRCPEKLPANISKLLSRLGKLWAESDKCPYIATGTKRAWDILLRKWADDKSLPLLVRKSGMVRGSVIIHSSGRRIIPTDNSPAQWACHLALRDIVPTVRMIQGYIRDDSIPVAFIHKKGEKDHRKYHCTLRTFSINRYGWQLCHVQDVGLNSRSPLESSNIDYLKKSFIHLMSPSNFFVVPKKWGGMGDTIEFIQAFQDAGSPNQAL